MFLRPTYGDKTRKWPAIVIGLATAAIVFAPAAKAEAYSDHSDNRCKSDGYGYVYKQYASHGTSCATAYKVLDKWMYNGYLEDPSNHRVGRDGVLWKCNSYREYGKLNPYHVYCWSSQKQWHYSKHGGYYTTKSTWFTYRD